MTITISSDELNAGHASLIRPGTFSPHKHYYAKVLNAQVHPLVAYFMRMDRTRIAARYCHLNPRVSESALLDILGGTPRWFRWAGADLLHATDLEGRRRMVVIETNSCPSGNKSMPLLADDDEIGGYGRVLRSAFLPLLARRKLPAGGLAVIYDKNFVEASGYAAVLADLTDESVFLAPMARSARTATSRFVDGLLQVKDHAGRWHNIRAAFRYVTQAPWTRIPVHTRTAMLNPVVACLAGGRNKLMAAKAYSFFDGEMHGTGLRVRTPRTLRDLTRDEVPLQVRRLGGHAVVKVPYSNAGQGVYTITNERELAEFMAVEHGYDRFVVQGLIGNSDWSSEDRDGKLFHVGTLPDRRNRMYAADLRMMVTASPNGFKPVSCYARRAPMPLPPTLDAGVSSWDVLGTNLSRRRPDGGWDADTDRLMLMDARDFNLLGIGLDGLIEAYIQTVLAVTAVDRLASQLVGAKGALKMRLLRSLNADEALLAEVRGGAARGVQRTVTVVPRADPGQLPS